MVDDSIKGFARPDQHPSQDFLKESREDSSQKGHELHQKSEEEFSHSRNSVETIAIVEVGEGGEEPQKFKSNASSVLGPLIVVPRNKRRGLLGRFTIIPEVENPQLYERKTKWTLTLFVALAAAGGPLGSAIFMRKSTFFPIL